MMSNNLHRHHHNHYHLAATTVAVLGTLLSSILITTAYAAPSEHNNRINYCYTFDFIDVSTGELHTNSTACGETKYSCEVNRQQTAATDTTTVKVVRVDDSCFKFKEDVIKPNNPK